MLEYVFNFEICNIVWFGSTPRQHPVTVDKQSVQFYEGANTILHFPLLQGRRFNQIMTLIRKYRSRYGQMIDQIICLLLIISGLLGIPHYFNWNVDPAVWLR